MAGASLFFGVYSLIFSLLIIVLPITLLITLQVFLCKKGKRLGLVMPVLSLAVAILMTLSMAGFSVAGGATTSSGVNYIGPDGQEIPVQTEAGKYVEMEVSPRVLGSAVVVFLVTNIPTVVFGGIWLHYKGRRDTYEDLKRMRIEDLE